MFQKKIFFIGRILFVLVIALYFFKKSKIRDDLEIKNNERFFKEGFSTIVISSNTYLGRSFEYQLGNGLKVYFLINNGAKLIKGDSVYKEENTYLYKVYRKNEINKYEFLATYNFEKME